MVFGGGQFMKQSSNRTPFVVLITLKAIVSVLICVFPQLFMNWLYAISFFSPMFLLAGAYSGISKWLAVLLLGIIVICIICLIFFVTCLLMKRKEIKVLGVVLIGFFLGEAICCLFSFMLGSPSFGKVLGILFNIGLAISLTGKTGDGSIVP